MIVVQMQQEEEATSQKVHPRQQHLNVRELDNVATFAEGEDQWQT